MRNETEFPEYKQIFWRTVQRYESASESQKSELIKQLERNMATPPPLEWFEYEEERIRKNFVRACRIFCRVYGLTHLLKKYGLL